MHIYQCFSSHLRKHFGGGHPFVGFLHDSLHLGVGHVILHFGFWGIHFWVHLGFSHFVLQSKQPLDLLQNTLHSGGGHWT
jgi:hypothetical protein